VCAIVGKEIGGCFGYVPESLQDEGFSWRLAGGGFDVSIMDIFVVL